MDNPPLRFDTTNRLPFAALPEQSEGESSRHPGAQASGLQRPALNSGETPTLPG